MTFFLVWDKGSPFSLPGYLSAYTHMCTHRRSLNSLKTNFLK
jgi:hypothetical protein